MRHSLLLIYTLLLSITFLHADLLTSTPVGPGIIYHHDQISAGPWQIHVLEIDLGDTMNTLETVKAFNALEGYERTSSMANRSSAEGHRVIGAINGDFYASGGISIGAQIIKGTLLKRPYPRSVFALSASKSPLIEIVSFNGHILKEDSLFFSISGINETRQENQLVMYNQYFGTHTGTNQWGCEISVQYLEAPVGVNAPIQAIVTAKDSIMEAGHGNMSIPGGSRAILSGHGLARDFLNAHIFVGDTLTIQLNLPPSQSILRELIGGTPRLIRNGAPSVEWENESIGSSFTYDRHPRTAVGFSADSSHVYFFTVDGRQVGYSVGMSLFELADYMIEWGVYQGINLDGGGSTTMVLDGEVMNSPSDGTERTVANALMAISMAPLGPLAYISLPWEETFAPIESQLQISVTGTDSYYNPVSVPTDSLIWTCDPLIGTISATGLFTAAPVVTQGFIIVSLGDILDSVLVHVTDIASLTLEPDPVVLEINDIQIMSATARDNFNNVLEIEYSAYSWWVSPDLAAISADGAVLAQHLGVGSIQATYHGVSASVPLIVGSPDQVMIDDFSDVDNYSLSGAVINLSACALTTDSSHFVSSPSSGRLDYSLTTGGTSVLYLDCNIQISGSPEYVSIEVYGDNSAHWLRGEFKNAAAEKFIVNFTDASPGINWNNEWRELSALIADATPHWGNPNASLSFPITWTKLYLAETNDNNKDSGTLYIDNLTATHLASDVEGAPSNTPTLFQLEDHYPNPFNASTNFRFHIVEAGLLELRLYSVDGRLVDTLKREAFPGSLSLSWEPGNLPSGVYFFKASLGQQDISGKCLLVK